MERQELDHWFVSEILPLEQTLMRFLGRVWFDGADAADLRQESYIRAYEAAAAGTRPQFAKAFLLRIARNLVIDRARRKNVVSIENMADFETMNVSQGGASPEDHVAARQQIDLLQAALDKLPPRCRQIVILRKVEGLSQREVARQMNISEETIEHQIAKAMRALELSVHSSRASIVTGARRFIHSRSR